MDVYEGCTGPVYVFPWRLDRSDGDDGRQKRKSYAVGRLVGMPEGNMVRDHACWSLSALTRLVLSL